TATMTSGWNYLQLPDPGAGFRLSRVVRSDGKEIRVGDNAWTTDRTFPSSQSGAEREFLFHLLDSDGTGSYTLYYRPVSTTTPAITGISPVPPNVTDPVSSVDVT